MGDTIASSDEKINYRRKTTEGENFRRNLIRSRKKINVFDEFEPLEVIGNGSISTVTVIRKKDIENDPCFDCLFNISRTQKENSLVDVEAVYKKNCRNQVFALKTIKLRNLRPEYIDELQNEVDILKRMDHPNIIKVYEIYEHYRKLSIVMELCSGDLYSRDPYTEREASQIVCQVLSAVSYMHKNNIIHRDREWTLLILTYAHTMYFGRDLTT